MALGLEFFSPSYIHAVHDHMLSFNVLLLCKKCYLEDDDNDVTDFLISPLYTPKSLLARFPPTHVMVCEMDPLHDDAVKFASKMVLFKKRNRCASFAL